MKIRVVRAELFHAGGQTGRQTDMTKVIVAFRNFANEPRNCQECHHSVRTSYVCSQSYRL
jgi:hypothetical protein